MGKLKYALLGNFHPCSVLRASVNQTMGIHLINFSSVLRAACKYELALIYLMYEYLHLSKSKSIEY